MNKNNSHHRDARSSAVITPAQSIKLGLDVHADSIVVVRIVDGQSPQPPQRLAPEAFIGWAQKQLGWARQVFSCYEAGPLGYTLHRRLCALGIVNYVVRPRDWDQYGQKVKTDKRDARELALALDRYVSGNQKACTVIRVPTEAEEQRRSLARQRQALQKHKQRLAAQGRGHALYYGHRLQGQWWIEQLWILHQATLPFIVVKLLAPLRTLILATEAALSALTDEVAGAHRGPLPVGVGELTAEILEREIANWNRFKNRRQVASYTGLCPSEDSSGPRRFQGHINKHGNRRVRPLLIELMWRLTLFQPTYRVVQRWRPKLMAPKASASRRKQIIVAMARAFSVDWWRLRTGRTTPEKLGLRLKGPPVGQSKRHPTQK